MKKFVSLCAFVAALSFVSCEQANKAKDAAANTVETATCHVKDAVEAVETTATDLVDSLGAGVDSLKATVEEAVQAN